MNNIIGFLVCLAYVFAVIGAGEALRRKLGYGSGFTRKVIHIGVGMMSWALPFLFDNPWPCGSSPVRHTSTLPQL